MKKLNYLLGLGALVVLLFASGCGDDDTTVDPEAEQLAKMTATWTIDANDESTVTFKGDNSVHSDFAGMTLTIDGNKNYQTSGADSDRPEVWATSGSFEFESGSIQRIIRDGKVPVDIVFNGDASTMTLTFELTDSNTGGRLDGFVGTWVFKFSK